QAAAVRRDVLDQIAARRRRRYHRADLQGARRQARLRLRRLGLADRVSRDDRDLTGLSGARGPPARAISPAAQCNGRNAMAMVCARIRLCFAAIALLLLAAMTAPVAAQQP